MKDDFNFGILNSWQWWSHRSHGPRDPTADASRLEHNFASFSFGQLDTLNWKLSWASNLCVSFISISPCSSSLAVILVFSILSLHFLWSFACSAKVAAAAAVAAPAVAKLLPHATLASGQCFSFATVFYRCCQKLAIYSQLDGKLALCKWGVHTIVKHANKT